jgi:hypothetical protein
MKTRIPPVLIALTLVCFALSPQARAVCQEGCLIDQNTVFGDDALISLAGGTDNTAMGFNALYSNTTGYENTATGSLALFNNTGHDNTANGAFALYSNTTASFCTAIGASALSSNTSGGNNTAIGFQALLKNTTGAANTATGGNALYLNTGGFENTATGGNALFENTTGHSNTANGFYALLNNTRGHSNTATGDQALLVNTTGDSNIALGFAAGKNLTVGSNNIDVGNIGVRGESKTIRIGTTGTQTNAYMAGISGATIPTGIAVIIDTDGHLGTTTSSARFKEAIRPMDKASEAILALKPVTFRYKHEFDPKGIPQFGLVAEQVEKVNPDLVARDEQGKPYTVRYEAVNAMLLNEFLKEHNTVQELKNEVAALTATVKKQTAQIQKVSAQLEASKAAPQVVGNP